MNISNYLRTSDRIATFADQSRSLKPKNTAKATVASTDSTIVDIDIDAMYNLTSGYLFNSRRVSMAVC
ncbi:MAG: hypothetical protein LC539_00025 [Candidatus Thiodiazotropha sp.]|nr:hypothetical protein [Candidatus Thiodiazotropha sp.]